MLPAQAGVILEDQSSWIVEDNAPRAGGGDPITLLWQSFNNQCSPRRRG